MAKLKNKKFWLNLLLVVLGWIIPPLHKWIDQELTKLEDLIKTKKSEINLDKIQNKNKKARK